MAAEEIAFGHFSLVVSLARLGLRVARGGLELLHAITALHLIRLFFR